MMKNDKTFIFVMFLTVNKSIVDTRWYVYKKKQEKKVNRYWLAQSRSEVGIWDFIWFLEPVADLCDTRTYQKSESDSVKMREFERREDNGEMKSERKKENSEESISMKHRIDYCGAGFWKQEMSVGGPEVGLS